MLLRQYYGWTELTLERELDRLQKAYGWFYEPESHHLSHEIESLEFFLDVLSATAVNSVHLGAFV